MKSFACGRWGGGGRDAIRCWLGANGLLAGMRAHGVSPRRHPGSEAGLKFNDASCRICQLVSANELARLAARRTWKCSTRFKGAGS
ncbi:unnamed protein product [Lota lota]